MKPRTPPSGDLWKLMRAELGEERLGPSDASPGQRRPLMGIALSGGGIRSATFNLGLLQGLNGLGILKRFDYLSTVSGGGYLGGFWTRWLTRQASANESPSFPSRGSAAGERGEPREVQHLREFGNFLAPRLGLFSNDTGRMVSAAINAMLPAILASFSLLLLIGFGWAVLARSMFAGGIGTLPPLGALTLGAVTLAVFTVFEWRFRRSGEPLHEGGTLVAWLISLIVPVALWGVLLATVSPASFVYPTGGLLPEVADGAVGLDPTGAAAASGSIVNLLWLLAPVVAWGAAIALIAAGRTLASRHTRTLNRRYHRAAYERAQGRLAFLIAAWTVLSILWICGMAVAALVTGENRELWIGGLGTFVVALGWIFAKVQQLVGRKPNASPEAGPGARLGPLLPRVLAYLTVGLLLVSMMALLQVSASMAGFRALPGLPLISPLVAVVGLAALISLLTLLFFDPNEIGIHSFYRGRLVRAYLGASNTAAGDTRLVEELEDDDIRLDRIRTGPEAPFHLICCAVNDLAGDSLENLNRGARSGVLSKVGFSVDGHWARWPVFRDEVPTLGGAMTASGAAFNSLMGSHSVAFGPAVTYLMATLNLRLGLWLPHPAWLRHSRGRRNLLPGRPFYREMFGMATAMGREVHISDGGHFENTAAYELVRRGCRVIVASDCGADPDVAFDDVANLIRRVRKDFGADIRIDLSPLRPDPTTGLARQPMVAGDIHYSDGSTGVLLLFKPTMVGSEPAEVTQYERRNPVFPHESTGDQFYGEAQWEAYRRLGEHAARSAFQQLSEGVDLDAEELFARARREWQPTPAGFGDSLTRFSTQIAELDSLLHQKGCETLLREVYKEIPELDRQVVQIPGIVVRDGDSVRAIDPARDPATPRADDLAPSLHLIRRMLLLMYEVYERDELERNSSHPAYLGLMNYFARWAYAPLFRMWWPLLRALYPQPFVRFVERTYGLRISADSTRGDVRMTAWVDGAEHGFATNCWVRQRGGRGPDSGRKLISYHLAMRYRETHGYSLQAALLHAARRGPVLLWDAPDFYVPPGLWGIGIGTDFLRLLGHGFGRALVSELVVRLPAPEASPEALKRAADEVQLYRGAGFEPAIYHEGVLRVSHGQSIELPPEWRGDSPESITWFVRQVGETVEVEPPGSRSATARNG